MEIETKSILFDSTNGLYKVSGKIWIPRDCEIKGVIQISHGMCEYIDKYNDFAEFMLNQGFAVAGHDHIGHGNSVNKNEDKGFFASKDGYKFLIEDLKKVTEIIKEEIPNKPFYLIGHSMGSLIARCYIAKYGNEINGLVLCGTVGPQPLVKAGIKMANFIADKKGERYRSRKIYDLSLDFANIKFLPAKTRYDWVSSDEEEVKRHMADKNSNFIFTVRGFSDLFHLVNLANSEKVIKTIPKNLPIIFMSGDKDPIGENGTGILKAAKLYKNMGVSNVRIKLYPNKRHELLKEKNKKEVFEDISKWIKVHI
ncbi:MAG: lysophospholipase [Clostridia bacterium]|nr:lysophospholipase [Clostridia bacterium]